MANDLNTPLPHTAIVGPSQLVKIDDGQSVHVRTAAEWIDLARRDLQHASERETIASLSGCAPRLFGTSGALGSLGQFGLTFHVDPKLPEDVMEFRDAVTGRVLVKLVNVGRS